VTHAEFSIGCQRPCVHCKRCCCSGSAHDAARVYCGTVGPFCDVTCRESWLWEDAFERPAKKRGRR